MSKSRAFKKNYKPNDVGSLIRHQQRLRGGFNDFICFRLLRQMAERLENGRTDRPLPKPTSFADLYALDIRFKGALLEYPHHLQPFIDELEKTVNAVNDVAVSAPPRHYKTTTIMMYLAFMLLTQMNKQHLYVCYSGTRARDVAKDLEHLLRQMGCPAVCSNAVVTFGTNTVKFVGLDQGITGYTVSGLCIIDDPIKTSEEARSSVEREKAWRGYNQNVLTRRMGSDPGGSPGDFRGMSVVIMHTRWDIDDLIGRAVKTGMRYINLKAICDDDETTLPVDRDPLKRRPGEPLLSSQPDPGGDVKRNDERAWFCMYQGEPAPEGLRLFGAETTYTKLPNVPMTVLYGLDSAYATKRGSDWSVLCRWLFDKATGDCYLDRVVRVKLTIESFGKLVAAEQSRRPGPITWFVGGQELYTSAAILRGEGVKRLECITARGQLLVRVGKIAGLWNRGKLLVPAHPDVQTQQFIEEVTSFSPDSRGHDDCVAAIHGALHSVANGTFGVSPANKSIDPDPVIRERQANMGRTSEDYERELLMRASRRPTGYSARR